MRKSLKIPVSVTILIAALFAFQSFIILNLKLSTNLSFLIALILAGITYAVVSVLLRTRQAIDILKVILKKF